MLTKEKMKKGQGREEKGSRGKEKKEVLRCLYEQMKGRQDPKERLCGVHRGVQATGIMQGQVRHKNVRGK